MTPVDLSGSPGVERLRRDRVTVFAYASFCAWGWFIYGFGVVVPILRDEQHTGRAVAALHSSALAAGGFVAGLVAAMIMRRWQRRGASTIATGVTVLGACVFLIGSPTPLTLGAAFVAGLGGSLLGTVAVPTLMHHHGQAGSAALSEGNGHSAGVALIAPLAVGLAVGAGWTWRPAVAVYLPLLAFVMWRLWTIPRGTPALDGAAPAPVVRRYDHASLAEAPATDVGGRISGAGRLPRAYWPFVAVVTVSVGIEFTTATWTADLLVDTIGVSAARGTAMVSTVIAGMAAGRFAIGRLSLQFRAVPLLLAAFGLTFAGWAIIWTSSVVALTFVGLAVTGLGIAGQYPLAMTLCVEAAPGLTDKAIGVASAAISVAIGVAPFALGALADATDIHTAFLVVPLLIAMAVLVLTGVSGRARPPARANTFG